MVSRPAAIGNLYLPDVTALAARCLQFSTSICQASSSYFYCNIWHFPPVSAAFLPPQSSLYLTHTPPVPFNLSLSSSHTVDASVQCRHLHWKLPVLGSFQSFALPLEEELSVSDVSSTDLLFASVLPHPSCTLLGSVLGLTMAPSSSQSCKLKTLTSLWTLPPHLSPLNWFLQSFPASIYFWASFPILQSYCSWLKPILLKLDFSDTPASNTIYP